MAAPPRAFSRQCDWTLEVALQAKKHQSDCYSNSTGVSSNSLFSPLKIALILHSGGSIGNDGVGVGLDGGKMRKSLWWVM